MPLYSDCEIFPHLTATFNRFVELEIVGRVVFLVWNTGRQPPPRLPPVRPAFASFAGKRTN
jgi:hypothetical protein